MKLSNTWFALILIGSVLLLSAENPSLKPSPRPSPKPVPLAIETAQNPGGDKQRAQTAPSALNNQQTADQSKRPAATNTPTAHYQRVNEEATVAQAFFACFVMFLTRV